MEDLGVAGRGLSNGRKLDQLSPGNAEFRALATSGSSLEDQRLTAPQKRQWVPLLDTRECVPRRGGYHLLPPPCGVPPSASALFLPVTMVIKYSLSVC